MTILLEKNRADLERFSERTNRFLTASQLRANLNPHWILDAKEEKRLNELSPEEIFEIAVDSLQRLSCSLEALYCVLDDEVAKTCVDNLHELISNSKKTRGAIYYCFSDLHRRGLLDKHRKQHNEAPRQNTNSNPTQPNSTLTNGETL